MKTARDRTIELNERTWKALHDDPEIVTASQVPVIMGLSPYKTPLQLWAEKLRLVPTPQPTTAMLLGTAAQPLIVEAYRADTGQTIEPWRQTDMVQHPGAHWLFATPDGIIREDFATRLVELKWVGWRLGNRWDEGIPLDVQAQIGAQLACWGDPASGVAVAFIGGEDLRWATMEYPARWAERMLERCDEFRRLCRERIEPPADWRDNEALKMLHPEPRVQIVVPLDGSFGMVDQRRVEIKNEIKAAEQTLAQLDARLKQAIGDAEGGTLADGTVYTWKAHSVKARHCESCGAVVQAGRVDRPLRRKSPKGGN